MIKHFLFIFAIVAMLCACSAEQLGIDTTASNQIEVKAKLQLGLSSQANTVKKKEKRTKTRVSFETKIDENNTEQFTGSYIKEGQPVLCILRNKETNKIIQATTTLGLEESHEDTKDNIGDSGNKYNHRLTINNEFTFTANPEEDLTQGEWYFMCFVSNHVENGKVHVDTPPHFHQNIDYKDSKYTQDVDVPFASLWKKVNVEKDENGTLIFTSDTDISMRMLGSMVKMNINLMPASVQIRNFTLISSGDTKGYFNLTEENIKKLDLAFEAETDKEIDESKNEGYEKIIDLMWQGTSKKETESQLSYTHYNIPAEDNYFVTTQGGTNNREDVFWFVIKPSTRGPIDKKSLPNLERYKTQFLLHAILKEQETRAQSTTAAPSLDKEFPGAYANFPFYGSKYKFESGTVYNIYPTGHYTSGPLQRMNPEGNYIDTDTYSKEIAQAKYFTGDELNEIQHKVKGKYHIPTRFEWQTIFPRCMNMEYEKPQATTTFGSLFGYNDLETPIQFAQYFVSHQNQTTQKPSYTHIVTLSPFPTEKTMGAFNQDDFSRNWDAEKATAFTYGEGEETPNALFLDRVYNAPDNANFLSENIFKHAIRIDFEDGKMKLTQRLLGQDFILDPFDIDTDAYWKYKSDTGIDPLSNKEMQRELPLWGYETSDNGNTKEGLKTKAIYWSNTEAKTDTELGEELNAVVPINTDDKNTRLPLYFDFSASSYKWRTDNVNSQENTLYNNEKPKFKAILHLFKNLGKPIDDK